MDFDRALMEKQGWGSYEPLPPEKLPPVYVAYRTDLAESSDVFHNDIRGRYNRGEPDVVEAMTFWADLTVRARAALLDGRADELAELLNANFDRRRRIYQIHPDNIAMVEAARSVGASAKFTGSGGAIVGTFRDGNMFDELCRVMEPMGIRVLKPHII
jgi:glucuronokinase